MLKPVLRSLSMSSKTQAYIKKRRTPIHVFPVLNAYSSYCAILCCYVFDEHSLQYMAVRRGPFIMTMAKILRPVFVWHGISFVRRWRKFLTGDSNMHLALSSFTLFLSTISNFMCYNSNHRVCPLNSLIYMGPLKSIGLSSAVVIVDLKSYIYPCLHFYFCGSVKTASWG